MDTNVRYMPGGSMVARWLPNGDYIVNCYRGHLGCRIVVAAHDPAAALDAAERHPWPRAAYRA